MRNIFDLYNRNIDVLEEINELYELFFYTRYFPHSSISNYIDNHYFQLWKYSFGKINSKSFFKELMSEPLTIENLLLMCEFYLNMIVNPKWQIPNENPKNILINKIKYILERNNYEYRIENDKIIITKKDVDLEETLKVVNQDLKTLLLSYSDFKISNNLSEKEKILLRVYEEFEKIKAKIPKDISKKISNYVNNSFKHTAKNNSKYPELLLEEKTELLDIIYHLFLLAFRLDKIDDMYTKVNILLDKTN